MLTQNDNSNQVALHARFCNAVALYQPSSPTPRDLWTAEQKLRFHESVFMILQRFQNQNDSLLQRLEDFLGAAGPQPANPPETFDPLAILDHSPDGIIVFDLPFSQVYFNQSAQTICGFPSAPASQPAMLRQLSSQILQPKSLMKWLKNLHSQPKPLANGEVTAKNESVPHTLRVEAKDGRVFEVTAKPLHAGTARPACMLSIRDISQLESIRSKAEFNSRHDSLTGLPNRDLLLQQLKAQVQHYCEENPSVAVLFFDLDGFKFVNDSLGHQAGDDLLRMVSDRINSILDDDQTLFRLGGDEFVVLALKISNLHNVLTLAESIGHAFVRPFVVEGKETHISASIGIAILNDRCKSAEHLLQHADLAMYQAKEQGGHGHAFYNSDVEQEIQKRYKLRAEIRDAIDHNEFEIFYQPKYDLQHKTLAGAEALIRWFRDGKFYSSPALFIPEAETCGLIIPLSQWVFGQVARDVADWEAQGLMPLLTSVNVSACHFQIGDLMDDLMQAFLQQGVPAQRIELEITESSFFDDMERAAEKIRALQRLGFSVSIDDFGTGHSSLSYLKRLPSDCVKIDRSFVAGIETSEFDRTLVESVIKIAHTQGLHVVAEGVETEDCAALLTELGCDQIQGYWYGKPMPKAEFVEKFLRPASDTPLQFVTK